MPQVARQSDTHTSPKVEPGPVPHVGGPIAAGSPDVTIEMLPAARARDQAICVGPIDAILKGSPNVLINKRLATRLGDATEHGGVITRGATTVLIGEEGDSALSSATGGLAADPTASDGDANQDAGATEADSTAKDPSNTEKKTLIKAVLFFGGGGDATYENVQGPFEQYQAQQAFGTDVELHYFSWTNKSGALSTLAAYKAQTDDLRVALVGHSYGGDTAYLVARDAGVPIRCLVKVDAASWFTFRIRKPTGVRRWINVWIVGLKNFTDVIAVLGGHWGEMTGAENHSVQASSSNFHGNFAGLFAPWEEAVTSSLL